MRSQLRLRVLLPVAVLGLLGAGFSAFAFGGTAGNEQQASLVKPLAAAKKAPAAKPAKAQKPAAAKPAKQKAKQPTVDPLTRELRARRVVVVVLYSPDSPVDTLATREARAGADAVNAGFLAVDVSNEKAVRSFAAQYGFRKAPALLVFARGPKVVTKIEGFVDRQTVAQAAENAAA